MAPCTLRPTPVQPPTGSHQEAPCRRLAQNVHPQRTLVSVDLSIYGHRDWAPVRPVIVGLADPPIGCGAPLLRTLDVEGRRPEDPLQESFLGRPHRGPTPGASGP